MNRLKILFADYFSSMVLRIPFCTKFRIRTIKIKKIIVIGTKTYLFFLSLSFTSPELFKLLTASLGFSTLLVANKDLFAVYYIRFLLESSRIETYDFIFSRSLTVTSGAKEVSSFLLGRVRVSAKSFLMILTSSLVILERKALELSISSS